VKYSEAIQYLQEQLPMFQRQGKKAFKKDLKNIKALCRWLGNPEKTIRTIHIAGTNGKGSTAHLLAGILQANNLRIGMYTSPHYKDFRERIKINGQYIPKSFVKSFVKKWQQEGTLVGIQPSFFELTVAMAFLYFAEKKVDYLVLETGLGGRLDSTNVVNPELSIITNISYDHTQFLGNTLKRIAKEKAGIIKRGVPVLIGERQEEVRSVFERVAKQKNSKLSYAQNSKLLKRFTLETPDPFLMRNIKTAVEAYRIMSRMNKQLERSDTFVEKAVKTFKEKTAYIGRWQKLGTSPDIFVDSAHNEAGLRQVFSFVKGMEYKNLKIVFGMVHDKDPSKVFALMPMEAEYYFAKADIPRGKNAQILMKEMHALGFNGKAYSSVKKALASAKRASDANDLILVIGSIFVVAEVL